MSDNYSELTKQAKDIIDNFSKEAAKDRELKKLVRDFKDKLEEIDRQLNDDTDSKFEEALDRVVDKVDNVVPFVTKKFLITSVLITVAVVSLLIYITS